MCCLAFSFDIVVVGGRKGRLQETEHARLTSYHSSALGMTHAGHRLKSKVYSQNEKWTAEGNAGMAGGERGRGVVEEMRRRDKAFWEDEWKEGIKKFSG